MFCVRWDGWVVRTRTSSPWQGSRRKAGQGKLLQARRGPGLPVAGLGRSMLSGGPDDGPLLPPGHRGSVPGAQALLSGVDAHGDATWGEDGLGCSGHTSSP